MTGIKGTDILHVKDLKIETINLILETASRYESVMASGGKLTNMTGKILATLFFEPSTQTRLTFETAMIKMGGNVVSVTESGNSNWVVKGERLYDTGRMLSGYADVAVIRHAKEESAKELADGATIPVINGGNGVGQHPTQALMDLYTIQKEIYRLNNLTITMAGDLKNGRTVHSLAWLLGKFGTRFFFVSTEELRMPEELTEFLKKEGVDFVETTDIEAAIAKSDILYMTRVQKERFSDETQYERLKDAYVIDNDLLHKAKHGITIMHPFPRLDEIAREVDQYEHAAYFRQASNGVPVRMAILALVTGNE